MLHVIKDSWFFLKILRKQKVEKIHYLGWTNLSLYSIYIIIGYAETTILMLENVGC